MPYPEHQRQRAIGCVFGMRDERPAAKGAEHRAEPAATSKPTPDARRPRDRSPARATNFFISARRGWIVGAESHRPFAHRAASGESRHESRSDSSAALIACNAQSARSR